MTADGKKMETDRGKVLCRYFQCGACSNGSSCLFSHDRQDKPSMLCRYYLKGLCSYGKECRYDHIRPENIEFSGKSARQPILSLDNETSKSNLNMVTLGKQSKLDEKSNQDTSKTESVNSSEWIVNAPEFVPGQKVHRTASAPDESDWAECYVEDEQNALSYSEAACSGIDMEVSPDAFDEEDVSDLLCPFAAVRECTYANKCPYLHGLRCDLCGHLCLHPNRPEQQAEHRKDCMEMHERDMQYSFAVQRSEGVECLICLDVVTDKTSVSERRFGILENCGHPFCLGCIRKWRNSSHPSKVIRLCPICRVFSGFVTPSEVWIDDANEKAELIAEYKKAMSSKECRHFDQGKGTCQFAKFCFYKHVYPDGRVDETQARFYSDADGEFRVVKQPRLWDFIEARDSSAYDG